MSRARRAQVPRRIFSSAALAAADEHIVPAARLALPALALEPDHNLRPARLQHNAKIFAQRMLGASRVGRFRVVLYAVLLAD